VGVGKTGGAVREGNGVSVARGGSGVFVLRGVLVGPKVGVGKAVWVGPTVDVLGGVLLGRGAGVGVNVNEGGLKAGVRVAVGRRVAVGKPCGGG
jgi:hypothetical protein